MPLESYTQMDLMRDDMRWKTRITVFGLFRSADLGQQYDTVPRVLFDTLILLCITFGVVRSLSSQVGLPGLFHPVGFSCVWARTPKFISGSSLRGVVTRAVFTSDCYGCFWGP